VLAEIQAAADEAS